jgi:hypothetical protein
MIETGINIQEGLIDSDRENNVASNEPTLDDSELEVDGLLDQKLTFTSFESISDSLLLD